jgi:hypothetical protein
MIMDEDEPERSIRAPNRERVILSREQFTRELRFFKLPLCAVPVATKPNEQGWPLPRSLLVGEENICRDQRASLVQQSVFKLKIFEVNMARL